MPLIEGVRKRHSGTSFVVYVLKVKYTPTIADDTETSELINSEI